MENKYFTPDIEDICVGYELEIRQANKWLSHKIQSNDCFCDFIDMDGYRVPYLTKEKIEAEGWKHIGGKMLSGAEQIYNKGIFNLYYTTSNLKLQVVNDEEDWSPEVQGGVKFEGFCKDINTFKKIIKLLGI